LARRNCQGLPNVVAIQQLVWNEDPEYNYNFSRPFDILVGTDLLYYKTDANVLMATIHALLAVDGIAFLPGIIRTPTLPAELLEAASKYGFHLTQLDLEAFINEKQLQCIGGWYTITFLVVQRQDRTNDVDEKLAKALLKCRQRIYVDEDEEEGELGTLQDLPSL
jgi:predicted nicotinamide N-methyase